MSFDLEHIDPEVVKNIKTLQDKLHLFGVDIDLLGIVLKIPEYKKQVIAEIIAVIRPQLSGEPLPADVDAVGDKLRLYLAELVKEAKVAIASQIFDAFEKQKQEYAAFEARLLALESRTTTSAGTLDVEALVKALIPVMAPVIVDYANQVYKENFKALKALYDDIDAKAKVLLETGGAITHEGAKVENPGQPQNAPFGGLGSLIDTEKIKAITELVKVWRGGTAPVGDLKAFENYARIDKIFMGLKVNDPADKAKVIAAFTGQPPAAPTPPKT